jgi:magnesium chelatase subunit D
MEATKAAVLSLLVDAYQKRDRIGLIVFGKGGAHLALAPTRSVHVAARELADLPVGGGTPLAAGLELAGHVVAAERRRAPGVLPLVVLLTDGRGNLPLSAGGDPVAESVSSAERLESSGVAGLVIDTEAGPVRLGLSRTIAQAWRADYRLLDDLRGERLPEAVRRALFARIA